MKKIIVLLLLALASAPLYAQSFGVPTFTQGYGSSATLTSQPMSAIDVPSNGLIWVTVSAGAINCATAGAMSVTDTGNANTFVIIGSAAASNFSGGACTARFWAKNTVAVANDVITIKTTGGVQFLNGVAMVSTCACTNPTIRASATASNPGSLTTTFTTGSISVVTGDIVMVGGSLDSNHAATGTAGTCANSANCTLAGTETLGAAEYQLPTTTSSTFAMTWNTSTVGVMFADAFTPGAAASTANYPPAIY